jgi:hypothetical protein
VLKDNERFQITWEYETSGAVVKQSSRNSPVSEQDDGCLPTYGKMMQKLASDVELLEKERMDLIGKVAMGAFKGFTIHRVIQDRGKRDAAKSQAQPNIRHQHRGLLGDTGISNDYGHGFHESLVQVNYEATGAATATSFYLPGGVNFFGIIYYMLQGFWYNN